MNNIDLSKRDYQQEYKKNISKEFWFESTEKDIGYILDSLMNCDSLMNNDRFCYVYCYGKQPQKTYIEIEKMYQGSVIWTDFSGPLWVKIFSFIISGQAGFLKIVEKSHIEYIIRKLSYMSMVGLFSLSSSKANEFENYINKYKHKSDPEIFIKNDPTYFQVIIDGDNIETESGLLAGISYGIECPKDLVDITKNFGEVGYLGGKT